MECISHRVTNVLYNGHAINAGPDQAFLNIVGCCNFRKEKSSEVYCFTGQGVISLKANNVCKKKSSIWASSMLKRCIVCVECCLLVPVTWLVRFCIKRLQSLTTHNRSFPEGCVYAWVASLLCSIFCSNSLVQLSTVSYRVFSANMPQTVSKNPNAEVCHSQCEEQSGKHCQLALGSNSGVICTSV